MGEPRPGDIAHPYYLAVAQVPLAGNLTKKYGDFLDYDETKDAYDAIPLTAGYVASKNLVQLQQDVETGSATDGSLDANAYGPGSWIYGIAASAIPPNAKVIPTVVSIGGTLTFGFATSANLTISSIVRALTVVTVTTSKDHGLHPGDPVTIAGTGNAAYDDEQFIVETVTSSTIFTVRTIASGAIAAISMGTVTVKAEDVDAPCRFIKVSGDTVSNEAATGNVCIFSMLGGAA